MIVSTIHCAIKTHSFLYLLHTMYQLLTAASHFLNTNYPRGMRFSKWCCWRRKSSGMLHCVAGNYLPSDSA